MTQREPPITVQIAGGLGAHVAWLPETLGRYAVAFGLWKGDLTLKRRLVDVIDQLNREGLPRECVVEILARWIAVDFDRDATLRGGLEHAIPVRDHAGARSESEGSRRRPRGPLCAR